VGRPRERKWWTSAP
jgi:hypothetical protein